MLYERVASNGHSEKDGASGKRDSGRLLQAAWERVLWGLPRQPLSLAWDALRPALNLPVNFLEEFKPLFSFDPHNVYKHWKQQRWWQSQVDSAVKKWLATAPLRMRKLKEPMAASFSVDVTCLVAPGPDQPAISDRGWLLSARMRIGMALDKTDSRHCPGCSSPMDPVGAHALCCAQLGDYARHNFAMTHPPPTALHGL